MNPSMISLACSTCAEAFKHASGPGDAAGWAIAFMLCIIMPILGLLLFFFCRLAKRENSQLDPQYQDVFNLDRTESVTN